LLVPAQPRRPDHQRYPSPRRSHPKAEAKTEKDHRARRYVREVVRGSAGKTDRAGEQGNDQFHHAGQGGPTALTPTAQSASPRSAASSNWADGGCDRISHTADPVHAYRVPRRRAWPRGTSTPNVGFDPQADCLPVGGPPSLSWVSLPLDAGAMRWLRTVVAFVATALVAGVLAAFGTPTQPNDLGPAAAPGPRQGAGIPVAAEARG